MFQFEVAVDSRSRGYTVPLKSFDFTLERFSNECHKTKAKVITLTNHNRSKKQMNQSEIEANTSNWRQAQQNACEQVTIGFGLTSDWLRKWREPFLSNQRAK